MRQVPKLKRELAMKMKALSGIMLTLLSIGILTLTFNVQPVGASGTIYIKADGSVDPPTAPILNIGNVYYAFTADIYESIVVERSNIIVDGDRCTLQGPGVEYGFYLYRINNVTIQNTNIKGFTYGIRLYWSSNNNISGNKITNNRYGIVLSYSSSNTFSENNIASNSWYGMWFYYFSNYNSISRNNITANNAFGIWLYWSSNYNSIFRNNITANKVSSIGLYEQSNYNSIFGNSIANNQDGIRLDYSSNNNISANNIVNNNLYGIWLDYSSNYNSIFGNSIANNVYGTWIGVSSNNAIYHNNFINNSAQALVSARYVYAWDNGYPSGGNFWSDYTGVDLKKGPNQDQSGSDGIGDTPYIIDDNNRDRYPLMTRGTHDIAVTNVVISKTVIGQGCSATINVTIQNQGSLTQIFDLTVYANAGIIQTLLVYLISGGLTTRTITWSTTGWTKGVYTLKAFVAIVPGETDAADNTFIDGKVKVTIPGDATGDGMVDLRDLTKLAKSWKKGIGDPDYNPNVDFNCDGIVDTRDLTTMAKNWMKSDP